MKTKARCPRCKKTYMREAKEWRQWIGPGLPPYTCPDCLTEERRPDGLGDRGGTNKKPEGIRFKGQSHADYLSYQIALELEARKWRKEFAA